MVQVVKSAGDGIAPGSAEQTGTAFEYVPGTTLGRSGYITPPRDRLYERAAQLDALMCVVASSLDDPDQGFKAFNEEIQHTVLGLASSLATEIHELIEQESLEEGRTRGHGVAQ